MKIATMRDMRDQARGAKRVFKVRRGTSYRSLTLDRKRVEALPERCSLRLAAQMIGVSLTTLQQWTERKKYALVLPRRESGARYVSRDKLLKWLEEMRRI